jgi:hypothetical protein
MFSPYWWRYLEYTRCRINSHFGMWHILRRSFSIVKDTLLDYRWLKFIQSNMNWKTNLYLYWGISQWSDFYKPHPSELSNANDALTNSVINTFYYADTTGDMAFLFQKFLVWDCVRLSNMSETLFLSKSPIKRNHKPTDGGGGGGANGLANKCRHKCRYFWKLLIRRMYVGQPKSDPRFY